MSEGYAFYAFYAWWFHFPQSGALTDINVRAGLCAAHKALGAYVCVCVFYVHKGTYTCMNIYMRIHGLSSENIYLYICTHKQSHYGNPKMLTCVFTRTRHVNLYVHYKHTHTLWKLRYANVWIHTNKTCKLHTTSDILFENFFWAEKKCMDAMWQVWPFVEKNETTTHRTHRTIECSCWLMGTGSMF